MSRMKDIFTSLASKKEKALITYIVAGDPNLNRALDYVSALEAGGADMIALGIPFSAPLATDPSIQAAAVRALRAGATPVAIFDLIKEIRKRSMIPLVLVTYYNPLFKMGEEEFMKRCQEAGADGLSVIDLPVEEASSLMELARKYGIDMIFTVTPRTDDFRLSLILEQTSGFLQLELGYDANVANLVNLTSSLIQRLRPKALQLPLIARFGLTSKEQISKVINCGMDGVIIDGAIVEKIGQGIDPEALKAFIRELKEGTRPVSPVPPVK